MVARKRQSAQPRAKGERSKTSKQPRKHNSAPKRSQSDGYSPALLALLDAFHLSRTGDTNCPRHDDRKASLSINPGRKPPYVTINCHAGCDSDDILESKGLSWSELHRINKQERFHPNAPTGPQRNKKRDRLPTIEECEAWHQSLLSDDKLLLYFTNRGLSLKTINQNLIGWDPRLRRYTFPVIEDDGTVVQLARYDRWAKGKQPKFKVLRGHDHALYLWDRQLRKRSWLLWCEGQWDALIARQHGLPAFTTTGGALTIKQEWIEAVADVAVPIAIALDCDDPGNKGAAKRAEMLAAEGATVKVINLGLEEHEDVNDWFVQHNKTADDLRDLIDKTSFYQPPVSRQRDSWPVLDRAAFHGLAGEVVRTIEPHTEADPAALLLQYLGAVGNAIGPRPHAVAEADHHPAKLNVLIVGPTAHGRKGSSWSRIKQICLEALPEWTTNQVAHGLASGEGLIAALQTEDDRRLLIQEAEFCRVLKVTRREGNTLSDIIRVAWESADLRIMTRKNPLRVDGAYVSVIGHTTLDELRRKLTETDVLDGFANRFLMVCSKRSANRLPEGGKLPGNDLHRLAIKTRKIVMKATKIGVMHRDGPAKKLWARLYNEMVDRAEATSGMFAAATARADAQMLRLSVIYALLDGSGVIRVPHLKAAWAVWKYCEASAAYIFGTATGSRIADRILAELQEADDGTIDRLSIYELFGNNVTKQQIDTEIDVLRRMNLAQVKELRTGRRGRPKQIVRKL